MSQGKIDMVIVGADRIAANGDTANKIGTLEKAIAAYRKAAEAGHADAQFELGRRFLYGEGLRKNSAHAISWLEKAAAQKHAKASSLLKQQQATGAFWAGSSIATWQKNLGKNFL